ncbi:MAG: prepilin-type N-terminal cleavage/methylation domain-containing protein, partial [Chloroflexi bacterium]|nr:prepilin-type N-terminal cleavage/methylation domain-containing protein [Chloroflexota bacterium]
MGKRGGFTLIELLVVVALMAALATVGFLSYGGYRNENHLKDEGGKIEAVLDNARANSMSQLNGAQWGVHFVNGTSSDVYQQFSGASFASGTPASASYSLGYGLNFGDPATSSFDLLFAPITGALTTDAAVTVVPSSANGMAENIIVNTLGQVTTRFETGLVGYWPLDEGAGITAYDASGYGDNGALVSGPVWQSGTNCRVGSCLSFNGTGSYVSLPSGAYFSGPFTITSWVYVRSYNSWSRLLDFGNGSASDNVLFAVSQGTSGDAYLESWNGTVRGFSLSSGV